MQTTHHPPQLPELVLCQAGLEQGSLGAAVLHHFRHVLQIHPLAPLQVVNVAGVALIQLVEEVVDSIRRGICEQLSVDL